MSPTPKARIDALVKEIERHNHLYYTLDTPEISDEAYNALYQELKTLEAKYPEYQHLTSPTLTVGGKTKPELTTHRHLAPMRSLENVFSLEEFSQFNQKRKADLYDSDKEVGELEWHVSPKYDGLAVALTYHHETLIRATTRGDGIEGEDITQHIRDVSGVPTKLKGNIGPHHMEIRGEVVMPHAVFLKANERRAKAGKDLFVNPRNAAAGVLRMKATDGVSAKGLRFIAYDIVLPEGFARFDMTHEETLHSLIALGVNTNHLMNQLVRGTSEVNTYYERLLELRLNKKLEFDIDGIVIRLNSNRDAFKLGYTSKSPRFMTSFKFPAEEKTSIVEDIVVQVGRTGKLTPVAKIKPVFVGGATVSSITLHNESEVLRKDVRIGDTVIVRRAGDVIPEIVGVIESLRSDTKPWVLTEHYPLCPECKSEITQEEGEKDYRCTGSFICPAQRNASILHAFSRKALNVDGMGESIVNLLTSKLNVKTPNEVYRLTPFQLMQHADVGEKTAHNLYTRLQASKQPEFQRFLISLGIRYVGEGSSLRLSNYVTQNRGEIDPFEYITQLDRETLLSLPDFGPKVANAVYTFFHDEHLVTAAKDLYQLLEGVKEKPLNSTGPLAGKVFVVTGSFTNYSRDAIEFLIQDLGGKVAKGVSKNVTEVICGTSPGDSKIIKAENLGIPITTPDDPILYLNNH